MEYKVLSQQIFERGEYKLIPIRHEDRFDIMNWRNEQIYHLRQKEPLTKELQDRYFNETISKLFDQKFPSQLLFSFLNKNQCIGYGGLVHINWIDKHAEVSFIMDTDLEELCFSRNWSVFLKCIEHIAFGEIELQKIFIYAFDLRPHLYEVLKLNEYFLDARLKDHCLIEGEFKDVVIYSKFISQWI